MPNNKRLSIAIVDVSYIDSYIYISALRNAVEKKCQLKPVVGEYGRARQLLEEIQKKASDYDSRCVDIWFVGFYNRPLQLDLECLGYKVTSFNGNEHQSILEQVNLAIDQLGPDLDNKPPVSQNYNDDRIVWEQLDSSEKVKHAKRYLEANGNVNLVTDGHEKSDIDSLVISERLFSTNRTSSCRSNEPNLRLRLARNNQEIVPYLVPEEEEYQLTLIANNGTKKADTAQLRAFHLAAPVKFSVKVREFHSAIRDEASRLGLEVQYQRRCESMVLSVVLPGKISLKKYHSRFFDRMADLALDNLLLGARPVPRWRSQFLIGFRDNEGKFYKRCIERETTGQIQLTELHKGGSRGHERSGYFLPELQELIMPDGKPGKDGRKFWSFELRDIEDRTLAVHEGNYEEPLESKLRGVRVHFNQGDTFWLEWEIEEGCMCTAPDPENDKTLLAAPCLEGANGVLWRHYLLRAEADQEAWSLAQVIDFNAEARLNTHDFIRYSNDRSQHVRFSRQELCKNNEFEAELKYEDGDREKTDTESGFRIGAIALALLKALFGKDFVEWNKPLQLTDSRSRIITSLVVDGNTPSGKHARDEFDALGARVALADPYGIGWAYDIDAAKDEYEQISYRRFWNWGSRFTLTDHCFAFVAFRHHSGLPDHVENKNPVPRPEFGEDPIHQFHMIGPYGRLYRFFLAIEANLRNIAVRLSELEKDLPDHRAVPESSTFEKLKDLRHELDRLSGRFINIHVSSQVQGRELAKKIRQQFEIEQRWNELDERVRRAEAQWRMVCETRHNTRMTALYLVGTLLTTLFGLYSLKPSETNPFEWIWTLIERMNCNITKFGVPGEWAMPLAMVLAGTALWCLVMIIVEAFACLRATSRDKPWRYVKCSGEMFMHGKLVTILILLILGAFAGVLVPQP